MIQAVLVFLVVMVVLGFGSRLKQLWKDRTGGAGSGGPGRVGARCAACGRPRIGAGPCPCGTGGG